MTLSILIDMNLTPDWASLLESAGFQAIHWSSVGDPRAVDRTIMDWAIQNRHVVFTHDLDFGTMLALSHETGPSVLQIRATNVLPQVVGNLVIAAFQQHEVELQTGALVIVDTRKSRVRILPLKT